jgi:hypothetical protein
MSVPAYKREAVNRMGARLRATLKRCDPPLPDSLRLIAVQLIKEAIVRGIDGQPTIHPGMTKMAAWGGCSERQARRNVRTLEDAGVMVGHEFKKGGRRATRYSVDLEAVIRLAMSLGANPHHELVAEIRAMRADMRADIEGGHKAGHMSAGIHNSTAAPLSRRALRVVGGAA